MAELRFKREFRQRRAGNVFMKDRPRGKTHSARRGQPDPYPCHSRRAAAWWCWTLGNLAHQRFYFHDLGAAASDVVESKLGPFLVQIGRDIAAHDTGFTMHAVHRQAQFVQIEGL